MKNLFKKMGVGLFSLVFAALAVVSFVGCGSKEEQKKAENAVLTALNQRLTAAERVDGKNHTMYDALKDVEVDDFSVAEENAKAQNKFVWNEKTDRFVIADSRGNVVEGNKDGATNFQLWLVSNQVDETFSTYYIGDALEIETSRGFDAGNADRITEITYTNEGTESATFRTNSNDTTLNINTNGTVKHYGEVGKLNIEKVAPYSYHENGKVRTAKLTAGRLVVEESGVLTLLVAGDSTTIENAGTIEAYVGTQTIEGQQAGISTSVMPNDDTIAIVKGEEDEAVSELPSTINDATIILLKDYDEEHPQVTITGETRIYGNMSKLNAKVLGDSTNVLFKNVHTTGIIIGEDNGFNGTVEFDGGQLDYDGDHFYNAEGAAFYANTGFGTYKFKNMTVSTGTNKGIKISQANLVLVENCVFDAGRLDENGTGETIQPEVYNRSLSCIDIQVQNATGKMTVEIRGNTFVNIPKGKWTNNTYDSDSAGAIKLKVEGENVVNTVLIENNTFTNCYRDVVVGVNIRLTSSYPNLNFPAKNIATLKDAQNNVENQDVYTIRNNTTTMDANSVGVRGVLIVDDQRSGTGEDARAYAENLGVLMGGCSVFNTYRSQIITNDTTVADIDALFGLE